MKVYKYGLLSPTESPQLVRDQMRLAHRYRNTLVEIERGRRAALRSILEQDADLSTLRVGVETATSAFAEAAQAVRAVRSESRSRSETDEARDRIGAARERLRDSLRAFGKRRREIQEDTGVKLKLKEIDECAAGLRRNARAHCGVFWGTYLLVEAADDAARKIPLYDGVRPNDPKFVRWQGEGRVGVQIQGGLPSGGIFGEDKRIRIGAVDPRAWNSPVRGERRRLSHTHLYLRVGSNEDRSPIWASWPMIMHRPLPPGSVIKQASVSLRRIGPRERWSVEITVAEATTAVRPIRAGVVAVDLGWRVFDDEIRVAAWGDEDGASGEIRLDARLVSELRYVDDLRSIRDKNFNAARDALVSWKAGQTIPSWLEDATRTLADWRSPARLAALARTWRGNRFDNDSDGYGPLEAWHIHDLHLWRWEANQRTRSRLCRREEYRSFAAKLAGKYGTLVLEDFDLRPIARRAPVDTDEPENETARSNRQLVAVSELRLALVRAFQKNGSVEYESAAMTTQTCSACGRVERFDAAESVCHTCSSCGKRWDQDWNAWRNLLARRREKLDDGGRAGAREVGKESNLDVVKESRWAKVKRMAREKAARETGAREVDGKDAE